jgi:hypothetical protein
MKNPYKILIKRRWNKDTHMGDLGIDESAIRGIVLYLNWIQLAQGSDRWRALGYDNEPSSSKKGRFFLDHNQLINKYSYSMASFISRRYEYIDIRVKGITKYPSEIVGNLETNFNSYRLYAVQGRGTCFLLFPLLRWSTALRYDMSEASHMAITAFVINDTEQAVTHPWTV